MGIVTFCVCLVFCFVLLLVGTEFKTKRNSSVIYERNIYLLKINILIFKSQNRCNQKGGDMLPFAKCNNSTLSTEVKFMAS